MKSNNTITRSDIVKDLVNTVGFSQREAKQFVEAVFDEISQLLENGSSVKISNFGNFILRDKGSRPGRNPRTGEPVLITPRRVVVFHSGQKLKNRVAIYGDENSPEPISSDTR